MNRLWLPGLVFTVWTADTVAIRTFAGVVLDTTLTLEKSERLKSASPKGLLDNVDCKGVVSCLHALKAGRRPPRGRHRDLESRALAALPAGVQIVWMKAHQSDRNAEEDVWNVLICKVIVWLMLQPTEVPENMCRLSLPRIGSSGALLPAPVVETKRPAAFPAAPFVCGPHLHVVEHESQRVTRPTPFASIVSVMWEFTLEEVVSVITLSMQL
eukprot:4321338-Amphidinium_carterae.1